jgi:hypothetical protein
MIIVGMQVQCVTWWREISRPASSRSQRGRVDDAAVDAEDRDPQALQLGALGRVGVAGGSSLGEAVAFGEGEPELGLQARRHRMRHRGAAA